MAAKRPLSPAELAQRAAASRAAAAKRRERGLTEAELAQRRINSWKQSAAKRTEIKQRQREIDRGIRTRLLEQGGDVRLSERDRIRNGNRLNRTWGIPIEVIVTHRLDSVSFDNPALQSFLRKWENLRAQGLSADQAVARLDRRWENLKRRDQLASNTMLDLVREHYPASRRQQRRHRRPLTDRQRERKRERDAKYRESQRQRRAA